MVSEFAAGVVLGLSAGFAPGPLLTLVITQTLRHNSVEGVKVAMAPLITDLPIVLASLFVLSRLTEFEFILGIISLSGGLYVLYLAYESLRTGPVKLELAREEPRSFRKGALINALNPHPYLFWTTVGAPLILKLHAKGPLAPTVFVACFYMLLVGSKVFLAVLVGKSKTFLSSRRYVYVMWILGALLVLFALILFKDALIFLKVLHS
jgi:threonine/homoserine/homoserine lactone efflux protein